jgi:DNA polymerase-3 subunit epsilon
MNTWGRLGVFDLETTGVDVDTSRIVSACVAVIDDEGNVITRWDWLADPGIEIPEGAAAVHGITTERARAEGRPAELVVAEVAQTLRVLFATGHPVVVYNAPYDLTLLDRECRRYGIDPIEHAHPVIDPLVMDKAVDRYRKGKRTLEVTAERYGVTLDDAHDAGADAIAAGRVAQSLQRAYPEELDVSAPDLHGRQETWYAEQAASFQDYIRNVKGDESYVAAMGWPVRDSGDPSSFLDTQPIPRPEPRPSLTVPVFDLYGTGTLSLESLQKAPTSAYATAPPPTPIREPIAVTAAPDEVEVAQAKRPTVLRVAAGIVTDGAGRALVVRKRGTSAFMQAGGKIEPGESALDALSRELREEIGLELDPDLTEYIGSYRAIAANEPDTVIRAEVFALVTNVELIATGEIEELLWIETAEAEGIDLAPLTRDTILPIWVQRRSALF